ncbi:MAG: substrate-binding domain-containing protein [Thermoplasmatales archaeon]|nr:substrate-binding domain-containing protein [Thermoplasmatales archaeon]MCW6169812.1 substrate-binding domain-containing protein [Thermoplasmatales archaeon]
MKNSKIVVIIVIIALLAVGTGIGVHYSYNKNRSLLISYVADAYVGEANYLLNGYRNSTGNPVSPAIGGGSYTDAQKIGSGDPANVFISVALSPYSQSYLKERYSGWAIAFASDQLVLAYYNNSTDYKIASLLKHAEITNNSSEFVDALSSITNKSNSLGISDPSTDPAGLRAWISLEIAGKMYEKNENYFVNAVINHHANVTRSSAAQLVPALETGEISFLFIYKSAAVHSGLNMVELPTKMNFGDPNLSSFYSEFNYTTAAGLQKGSPVLLYITALANNTLTTESLEFVNYSLNHRNGLTTFELKPLQHSELFNDTTPPPEIMSLLSSHELIYSGRID